MGWVIDQNISLWLFSEASSQASGQHGCTEIAATIPLQVFWNKHQSNPAVLEQKHRYSSAEGRSSKDVINNNTLEILFSM